MWIVETRRLKADGQWGRWFSISAYATEEEAKDWLEIQRYPSSIEYRVAEVNED